MTELKPCPRCQGTGNVQASSLGSPEHEAARTVPRATGDDAELVEKLRGDRRLLAGWDLKQAADRITALSAEVERLTEALTVYAGPVMDRGETETFPCWANGYPGGVFIDDNTLDFGDAARQAIGAKS